MMIFGFADSDWMFKELVNTSFSRLVRGYYLE